MMYDHESIASALLSASLDNFMDSDGVIKCCVEATVAQKAAEMLKEIEKGPKVIKKGNHCECPYCGEEIFSDTNPNYCGKCGRKIVWNG